MFVVGSGPLDIEIKNYIKKNDLSQFVKVFGARGDVQNFINIADIFLSTADQNIWSSTIAEAMLIGCPLVLADVDFTDKVFTNDFDSLLLPFNDKKMYLSKIIQLIDDTNKMNTLAINAMNTLKEHRRYDNQASKDYYDLYSEIIKMNEKE